MTEQRPNARPEPGSPEPATVFAALADIIYRAEDTAEVYSAVCLAATMVVPGCDHASMMLRQKGSYMTVAATDDVALAVDQLEQLTGEGPCLDAIEDESTQVEPNLRSGSQWPALAARVLAETPVRGSMGFRIVIDGRKTGALNLFSDTADSFDANAANQAIVLAAFASVAANAIAHGEQAASLKRGLHNSREIGKAIGMLMALHDFSETEAFATLRRASQQLNVKVADIARGITARGGPHQTA